MPDNRRLHPRYPVEIDVTWSNGQRSIVVQSRDISLGGIFVYTTSSRPPGTPVALVLHLPELGEVAVEGRVAHCLPGVGVGIQFVDMAPETAAHLERFLAATTYRLSLAEDSARALAGPRRVRRCGAGISPEGQPGRRAYGKSRDVVPVSRRRRF